MVCTVENKKSAPISFLFPENTPIVLVFPKIDLKVSIALLAIFPLCTINRNVFASTALTSKADKYVLPVPVADISNALFLPFALMLTKFLNASFCIKLGLITFPLSGF